MAILNEGLHFLYDKCVKLQKNDHRSLPRLSCMQKIKFLLLFWGFLTEISIVDNDKRQLFYHLIVYLLHNYFGVVLMAVWEVFISFKTNIKNV